MEILMVTAELTPFGCSSEVGDAVASLSRALCQLGHQVTVAMPKPADLEASGVLVARRLSPLVGADGQQFTLYDGQLGAQVPVVLFESERLEPRTRPYTTEEGKEYPDNAARFVELCRAATLLAQQREQAGRPFDVVHAHDSAGAAMALLSVGAPIVLTVYDARRQGVASLKELDALGLIRDAEVKERLKLASRGSLLKAGMLSADVVAAISPSYAEALKDEAAFGALAGSLATAEVELYGVLGGVDYAVYNPATDAALPTRFDAEDSHRKGMCKSALYRSLELEYDPEVPLVCVAGSLDKDSGADLVAAAAPELLKQPVSLVVIGNAKKGAAKQLGTAKLKRYPNYRFIQTESGSELRRALAAADVALCPSRFSPSGQNARIAQRFGAVPVASSVPGNRDAVIDSDVELSTGTGFLFDIEDAPAALVGAVTRAVSAYRGEAWARLRRRVMRLDLGWERPARRYLQLYRVAGRAS